jgi:hypothetical protein
VGQLEWQGLDPPRAGGIQGNQEQEAQVVAEPGGAQLQQQAMRAP